VAPDTVVVTINGKKFTAQEIQKIVAGVPPAAQRAYQSNPKQFLREHAWYQHLEALANKQGLAEQSPYKEILAFQRMTTLVQAAHNQALSDVQVSAEEQKAWYDKNPDRYREVKAKMIYIPFSASVVGAASSDKVLDEAAAKAKAEAILAKAKAGADFVTLVKENSEDSGSVAQNGDIGAVRSTTTHVPETMRTAVLNLKAGELSSPIRHENGYYIFRADSAGVLPYDQVKDEIYKELKDVGFKQWQKKTQAESSVQFENEQFFSSNK
jgi:parvulin-like peptidyl-prolyl isomerase